MNKKLFLAACFLIVAVSCIKAQKKLSIDKVYATYLRNSGTIMKNNQINGSFSCTRVIKLINIPMNILYKYWTRT